MTFPPFSSKPMGIHHQRYGSLEAQLKTRQALHELVRKAGK